MDQEEDDEESGNELIPHHSVVLVVLNAPKEIAQARTYKRQDEVDQ